MGKEFIHLAFFDGIGTAELALESVVGQPLAYFSWETCMECIQVLERHFPHVKHRGDVAADTPEEVQQAIQSLDPAGRAIVLLSGGPPCPDFSGIADSACGREGQEGHKFVVFSEFVKRLEKLLRPRDFLLLVENVVMQNPADTQYFTDALQAQPILVDPADFTIISRPRLFWTRVRWCDISKCPMTGKTLKWQKVRKLPKLCLELPATRASDIQTNGLRFHDKVISGAVKLPCLTTPAPTEAGRPPPRKIKGKLLSEVKQRWLQDQRCYAPWHYTETAMMVKDSGELCTLPVTVKEQLQGFRPGHTECDGVPTRSRHRMLANAWHFQVAKFLMMILLQQCGALAAPVHEPRSSALQFVLGIAASEDAMVGPQRWSQASNTKQPSCSMMGHWRATDDARHPLFHHANVEPGIAQVFLKWRMVGDVARMRYEVANDLVELIDSFSDTTTAWCSRLATHVRKVYTQTDTLVQVPMWMWLLECINYPMVDTMYRELTEGFATTGELAPGAGWQPRLDGKYANPVSREVFIQINRAYVQRKLKQRTLDQHWRPMLDEILEELQLGRLEGPFIPPPSWGATASQCHGLQLRELPDPQVLAAGCFSVAQPDKIRRCEDWRRSGHNSTVMVHDTPTHHTVDHYVSSAAQLAQSDQQCSTWGHDMAAAYRQLPVHDPQECYTFLQVTDGVCLFRHNALSFGAVASVWAFNRVADTLTTLARKLLWCPALHFVDDFGATEPEALAQSGFDTFAQMFSALGLRTKPKKAQPPAQTQRMLGVFISTTSTEAVLSPCPTRVARVVNSISNHLQTNQMTPDEAQALAGRLNFLQATSFGQMGVAMLAPLYGRAHFLPSEASENNQLSHALRTALSALLAVLPRLPPRCIPFRPTSPVSVLYTDAFFQLGDRCFHPGDDDVPWKWNASKSAKLTNGWGVVLKIQGQVYYCSGTVPEALLRLFAKRRAFIFVLEIIAQVIGFVLLRKVMTPYVCSYIDNLPGKSALAKGFGRDEAVNNLLSFFWCWLGHSQTFPHFEWVPSAQNIADPISRFDFSVVEPSWIRIDPDLAHFWAILVKVSTNIEFATSEAVNQCLEFAESVFLVQGGIVEPEDGCHLGSTSNR